MGKHEYGAGILRSSPSFAQMLVLFSAHTPTVHADQAHIRTHTHTRSLSLIKAIKVGSETCMHIHD